MTKSQLNYFLTTFEGAQVDDLGCGYSQLHQYTHLISYLGIDKQHIEKSNTIQFDLSKPCPYLRFECAFISWPINRKEIGWHSFLDKYANIVYVGTNTEGVCCADPNFWEIVAKREVIEVIPDRKETLIHYGSGNRSTQKVPAEEFYGIGVWEGKDIQPFSENAFA